MKEAIARVYKVIINIEGSSKGFNGKESYKDREIMSLERMVRIMMGTKSIIFLLNKDVLLGKTNKY